MGEYLTSKTFHRLEIVFLFFLKKVIIYYLPPKLSFSPIKVRYIGLCLYTEISSQWWKNENKLFAILESVQGNAVDIINFIFIFEKNINRIKILIVC